MEEKGVKDDLRNAELSTEVIVESVGVDCITKWEDTGIEKGTS